MSKTEISCYECEYEDTKHNHGVAKDLAQEHVRETGHSIEVQEVEEQ